MGGLMKARMLCVLMLSALIGAETMAKGKTDFNTLIGGAEAQAAGAHRQVLEDLPPSEAVAFYNTEWLRLKQRKRWAVAKAEIKLKRANGAGLENRPELGRTTSLKSAGL